MVSRETVGRLEVREVSKRFDTVYALDRFSLQVEPGEIVCLLGPSGSGKSTLLRCIAGLEVPDAGQILLGGTEITRLPPHRRGFGMMFQAFALFPHRTVAENIAFGLKMQGVPAAARNTRTDAMLDLVGLQGYGERSVFELSGGEQQRVALARSLAPGPPLLMLDEPLGALDRALRERLMDELRTILKEIGVTALYVTHDQQEAFAISDRIVLMDRGAKVQEGPPGEMYRQPINRFAARFFGLRNLLPATGVHQGDAPGHWRADTPLGTLHFVSAASPSDTLLLRPEAARLPRPDLPNPITGIVCERSFRGGHYRLVTEHPGGFRLEWQIVTPDQELPPLGAPITLALRPDAITFIGD